MAQEGITPVQNVVQLRHQLQRLQDKVSELGSPDPAMDAYNVVNGTDTREFDADVPMLAVTTNVLATLIRDLQARGLIP